MKPSLSDYRQFLAGVKNRVLDARIQAGRAINRELVLLYWDIGRGIVEKQRESGWGNSVVERFAADLRAAFPDMNGFSTANIWRMRQLFETCSAPDFSRSLREIWKKTANPRTGGKFSRKLRENWPGWFRGGTTSTCSAKSRTPAS